MKPLNENQRRIVMLIVIVSVGSILVLFDVPLTLMVPIVILAGFGLLVALGAITMEEIRGIFKRSSPAPAGKVSIIQRLNDMKFFEKKSAGSGPVPSPPSQKTPPKAAGATRTCRTR